MAQYSNNVTQKIGANVGASHTGTGGGFSYTVPNGSYLILVGLYSSLATGGKLGGGGSVGASSPNGAASLGANGSSWTGNQHFPAGSSISGSIAGGGLGPTTISWDGILFSNTP